MEQLPNFICVGAQRAGTTTLFNTLKLHPSISLSLTKEVHFFDNHENYKKGINWSKNFFKKGNKINGEITPDYMIYNFVPKRIFETLGENIKLIFLLRNPSQRAFSQFNFYLNQGVEKKNKF